ncbi:MAG: glycosyltransferase family 2 protein [Planctomycetaceae bacterium]|nr:glycosyltransferase family 2 protein [Planctomycetaceae bacterium]
MDLSIVLVNWNTRQILAGCLDSIYEQTRGITFEVLVVDNASTDGSARMVRDRFPQATLVANEQNRGFAAANNQGIRMAKGDYILLLNSDTLVLDNALAKSVEFARRHPEAGVVGCRVLNADRSLQPSCFMYPSLLNLFLLTTYLSRLFRRHPFFGRERMGWWDRSNVREVEVVTGCFMLVRRRAFESVGLLDEAYFMYGEETDWCCRAHRAGWKLLFTPDAEIVHLGGASSRQVRPEMMLQLRGSILLFMKKNRPLWEYWAACVLVALFFLLRTPYWYLRGLLAPRQRSRSFQIANTYMQGAARTIRGARGLQKRSLAGSPL